MNIFYSCKVCKKKVNVQAGTGLCICNSCRREYTVKSLEESPDCLQKFAVLDIKNAAEGAMTITIPENVISNIFKEEDEISLKNKILNLKNHDFLIMKKKKFVKDIIKH